MANMVRDIDLKLDGVRKERENAIGIIEGIVRETYKNHSYGSYVGIRWYGSMASGLAIEQSDVDLAVVGLDFQGNREVQTREMSKLVE
jgi:predicted nucleotidyltransferase